MPAKQFEPNQQFISRDIETDTLFRAIKVRQELSALSTEELSKRFRSDLVECFVRAGLTLIPSDNLLDHQIAVSRAVYDEAKKVL